MSDIAMRVVQVNAVNGVGSTGRSVAELAAGLERRGITSPVAYSSGMPAEGGYVIGSRFEKRVHALASRVTGRQAYFSRRGTIHLLRYLDEELPDLVHLHNLHSNFINLPMLLEYLATKDIATVVTLDDCWHYTGKCCHYTADSCYRWQSGCGSCPRLMKDNPSWLIDATAAMWTDKRRLYAQIPRLGVVGVSDWITTEARRSFLAEATILRRIHNWVDLDTFAPSPKQGHVPRPWTGDEFVMLGVASRWSSAKGLDDFGRLAEALEGGALAGSRISRAGGSRAKPRVVLVGAVDAKTHLPPSVSVVHPTDSARELAHYYRWADVLLQLSQEETFGKVVAEGLACGTPVIAYDSTANPELVGPGCGYVIEPGRIDRLVAGIGHVMELSRDYFSESCRVHAERNFDKESLIDEHVRLYRELCAQ
jgi:glycosyltransferase involved in cell wall biosynthesis